MNFRTIKLTNALFGGMHEWSLCGVYATDDGIELKFEQTRYDEHDNPIHDQTYCFTVIEDEDNYQPINMLENDFQQYWETVVEPFINDQLTSVHWSESGNDYRVIDELVRIDEVGELNCEQNCY